MTIKSVTKDHKGCQIIRVPLGSTILKVACMEEMGAEECKWETHQQEADDVARKKYA